MGEEHHQAGSEKEKEEEMKADTVKKLKNELEETKKTGGQRAKAIAQAVHDALAVFCEQQPEFEQAVEQSGKSLREVCEACVKGVGTSISDLEVYRRAVAEYFPGAVVECVMTIRMSEHETNPSSEDSRSARTSGAGLPPDSGDPETPKSQTSGKSADVLSLDLFDLMGG